MIRILVILILAVGFVSAVELTTSDVVGVNILNNNGIDHNLLRHLAWSVAGHTIDTDFDVGGNNITNVDAYCINDDCSAKMYHNGTGVIIKA